MILSTACLNTISFYKRFTSHLFTIFLIFASTSCERAPPSIHDLEQFVEQVFILIVNQNHSALKKLMIQSSDAIAILKKYVANPREANIEKEKKILTMISTSRGKKMLQNDVGRKQGEILLSLQKFYRKVNKDKVDLIKLVFHKAKKSKINCCIGILTRPTDPHAKPLIAPRQTTKKDLLLEFIIHSFINFDYYTTTETNLPFT